jgi:hypothetical protein
MYKLLKNETMPQAETMPKAEAKMMPGWALILSCLAIVGVTCTWPSVNGLACVCAYILIVRIFFKCDDRMPGGMEFRSQPPSYSVAEISRGVMIDEPHDEHACECAADTWPTTDCGCACYACSAEYDCGCGNQCPPPHLICA